MQVKEVLLKKVLKIENEETNKVFIVRDKRENTHIILIKEVLDEYNLKAKAFIMSFNQFKLVVNQYELINDLKKEDVLNYLSEKELLDKSISTNHHNLIQDLSYAYNLSKRYVMNERDNELLKDIFIQVDNLPYDINDSENVLSDVLLMTVFPNYRTLDFIRNIEQLIYLPKNELSSLIELNITTDVVLDNKKFLKLISKKVFLHEKNDNKYVKRIDISPFVLFENDGKLADFLKLMNPIPYKETTECHFYLNKDYLTEQLFSHVNVEIDDFLMRTYKETNLIQTDLRYVFFVEQLKKVQDGLQKLESLKGYSNLFEKEREFLFNKMNENELVDAFGVIDYLNQIDNHIKELTINYPTSHLDEWLVHKESITDEFYYVKAIFNHREYYEFVVKHLLNHRNKYFFKESGIDYIVIYNKKKQEIVLEIELIGNHYELRQIHSVQKELTNKEKILVTNFCNNNEIKFKAKRHLLLR